MILTAGFDPAATTIFQQMRDRHFPPHLNIVPAHLTLFHKLPGSEFPSIDTFLRAASATEKPMAFDVKGLRFLGRGVALEIETAPLGMLRQRLSDHWRAWLTPQDAQAFRPHVTVQNKTDPIEARALRDHLMSDPPRISGLITGLDLWHYRGGPWERAGRYDFKR